MITDNQLSQLGFSQNETTIYLTLLEQGPLFLQNLSRETGIKRTTLYAIIDKMIEKNIMGVEIDKKRKKYYLKDPQNLLLQLNQQKYLLEALMPELQNLFHKQTGGNRIQIYDTVKGVQKSIEEIVELDPEKNEVLAIEGDLGSSFNIGFDFWKQLLAKKKKRGIKSRGIIPSSDKDDFILKNHPHDMRTSAMLNNFKILLYLYSNKCMIVIPAETLCIIIENKRIKDSFTDIFEIVWKRSKSARKE